MNKSKETKTAILIHEDDNILLACTSFSKGEEITIKGKKIVVKNDIEMAHKIAFVNISKGDKINKYGSPIGSSLRDIKIGEHVHLHNMKSDYIVND